MAITGKRGSLAAMEFGQPHAPTVLEPDGSIDRADSFQLLDLFEQPASEEAAGVGCVAGVLTIRPRVRGDLIVNGFYIGSDVNVIYDEAKDDNTGSYLDAATVRCRLESGWGDDAVQFASCPWITMSKQAGDGEYLGVIDRAYTSQMVEGSKYQITVTFEQGDYDDHRAIKERASYRGRI